MIFLGNFLRNINPLMDGLKGVNVGQFLAGESEVKAWTKNLLLGISV